MTTPVLRQRARSATVRRRPHYSSISLKIVMATSGAILLLYLVLHMIGNLKIFFGPEAFNAYSDWLRTILEPALPHEGALWLIRVVLLLAVLLHIASAAVLTVRARRARPIRYQHRPPVRGSYAARTMRWGGVIVALFVIYHILDLTTGTVNPHGVPGEVYQNLTASFDRWYVTLFYCFAVLLVGIHVRHGLWSALQTLGVSTAGNQRALKAFALAFAVALTAGFLAVPLAVVSGLV